jgi:hypothetical protein
MVRKTLDGKSAHINAVVQRDGLTSLQYRKTDGATTEEVKSKTDHASIIQLERKGETYTMRMAKYGEPFVVDSMKLALGDEVYVGLFVGSHNADVVETRVFRDVQISVLTRIGFVPYREYLGSNLEVLEVASGNRDVVYTSSKSLQAPNWTPDGKTLIYNSDGLMYRFDFASRKPQVMNTGDIKKTIRTTFFLLVVGCWV